MEGCIEAVLSGRRLKPTDPRERAAQSAPVGMPADHPCPAGAPVEREAFRDECFRVLIVWKQDQAAIDGHAQALFETRAWFDHVPDLAIMIDVMLVK